MPKLFKVQVALADQSALARDQYINTFHLYFPTVLDSVDAEGRDLVLDVISSYLQGFYASIKGYLAQNISGTLNSIKYYDQDLPLESPPVHVDPMALNGGGITPGGPEGSKWDTFPNEVACVLTYHGAPQGGTVQRQSWRGRIFIGPLNVSCGGASTYGHSRPNGTFMANLAGQAKVLHEGLVTGGAEWVIASKVQQKLYPILNFAVDNSWDTIRSRGDRPSTAVNEVTTTHAGGGDGITPITHAVR